MMIMNPSNLLCYIFVFTLLILQCQSAPRKIKKCRRGEKCINIANCTSVMSELVNKTADQITEAVAESMRKKVCGFDPHAELQIKVCCPRLGWTRYIDDCIGYTHEHNLSKILPLKTCGRTFDNTVGRKIRGGKEVEDKTLLPWMAQIKSYIDGDRDIQYSIQIIHPKIKYHS